MPGDNEVFDQPDDCAERLLHWGFTRGCIFVKGRHRSGPSPARWYFCQYHGKKTQNNRDLEPQVRKDKDGGIVGSRSREGRTKAAGCPVEYYLSFRKPTGDSDAAKVWCGTWKEEDHKGHEDPINPLAERVFKKLLPDFQVLEASARFYRTNSMKFSEASKLLAKSGSSLSIGRKEYYNLIRRQIKDVPLDLTASALLGLLQEAGWKYTISTVSDDDDDNGPEKLRQIVFWSDDILPFAKRFTSDSLLYIDATFRTNKHGLPLIIAAGATNTNRTIPIAYSWCPEEDTASYEFFAKTLREEVYTDCPDPAVILADQGAGLSGAFAKGCFPDSVLEYYS